MGGLQKYLEFTGDLGLFASLAARRPFLRPFEFRMILRQIEEVGWKSLPLLAASGFAVGLVLTLHTRSSLIRFGAEAMIPGVQSLAFFNETGPLIAGLLVAGRVGAGILKTKSAGEIDSLIQETLDEVGLGKERRKMPVELSGGMRKRAGLARALVLDPSILLVDEPSTNGSQLRFC